MDAVKRNRCFLAVVIFAAAIFQMHTILFIARNAVTVMATAAIVVFQPELRRALETWRKEVPYIGGSV